MAQIKLVVGTLAGQYPTIESAWAAIPSNVVVSGNSYLIAPTKDAEIVVSSRIILSGKTTGPNNRIIIQPDNDHSYRTNPNFATNRLAYVPANGAAVRSSGEGTLEINNDWVAIEGMQFSCGYSYSHAIVSIGPDCANVVVSNCIVEGALPNQYSCGISASSGKILNPTIILRSAEGAGMYLGNASVLVENPTIVRTSTFSDAGRSAFNYGTDSATIANAAVFNFSSFMAGNSPYFTGKNNATNLASIPFGTGNKTGLVYADQFVNTADGTHDFRLKAGAALIDAGAPPSSINTTAPGGNRQQGTSADIGAHEFPQAIQAPSANVTAISVSGTTVTISGTFMGGATSGRASITPTAVAGNNAVAQGPKAVTIGSGTFTVQFTGGKVGLYNIALDVSNANYLNVLAQNDIGGFEIEGAKAATVVQDPMAGQILTIHGTVNGAVSGNLVVPPAAVNPNGAAQQSVAVTITGTTDPKNYTVSATLGQGGYGAGVLTFTNANGTSLPQAGTSPVTVMGFSGNPAAPAVDAPPGEEVPEEPPGPMVIVSWAEFDTQAPPVVVEPPATTVTDVIVTPENVTAIGGETYQFDAEALGANNPPQTFTWATTIGTVLDGLVTTPAVGQVMQAMVTATSTFDPTRSGSVSFTIAPDPALPPNIFVSTILSAADVNLTTALL